MGQSTVAVGPVKRNVLAASFEPPGCERPAVPSRIWRLRGRAELRWAYFGEDEFIAFDAASGQTHLFDATTAEVVERLLAGEAAEPELAALLRDLVGGTGPSARMLLPVLTVLAKCGLAEAAEVGAAG
jgi:hypothetical protein